LEKHISVDNEKAMVSIVLPFDWNLVRLEVDVIKQIKSF
jgi:hypothetical protein